ncbi:unnamed protein product [Callosobruchus maculatus]|uniref:Uncharacterized protein n=1 Tax=Callosobruchus maculatus TaxID=64391 RepID=A0A653DVR9_CALMS|nr:unnamed protein product [Callosobruchus maculatus]
MTFQSDQNCSRIEEEVQIQSSKKGGGEQKEPEVEEKLEEVGVQKLIEKTAPYTQTAYPGGREAIRTSFLKRFVPESGIDAILCSVNDRTHRQYDYVLRKWWSYCTRHLLDPFHTVSRQSYPF